MKNLQLFEGYGNKKVTYYHGLGGSPNKQITKMFSRYGYDAYTPYINYEKEWYFDKGKSMFLRELARAKNSDIIMGLSFGGYVAYNVAKALNKKCVLINPSINREKSLLDIRNFDMDYDPTFPKIKVFFGTLDDLVVDRYQIDVLNRNGDDYDAIYIEDMEHCMTLYEFAEILSMI